MAYLVAIIRSAPQRANGSSWKCSSRPFLREAPSLTQLRKTQAALIGIVYRRLAFVTWTAAANLGTKIMKHVTSRTWKPEDLQRLQSWSHRASPLHAPRYSLRRSIVSVKASSEAPLGTPFPDDRLLKRQRRARERGEPRTN